VLLHNQPVRRLFAPLLDGFPASSPGYDGFKYARTGRSPYLWTIVANRTESRGRLRGVQDQFLKTSL